MPKKKAADVAEASPETAPVIIHSIKGFNRDLTCRSFQFEVGKTFEVSGRVEACGNGFHACPTEGHPFSVFDYYAPGSSVFHLVEQSGASDRNGDKLASAKITIGVEITIGELVQRAWDWVWSHAVKSDEAHVTITQGAASSTGIRGAASSTGDWGAASSTGDWGAASSTGIQGAASSTGDWGAASSTGDWGAAMASGYAGKVMGADGNALFAVERNDSYEILSVAAGIVGRDGIVAGAWYRCVAGKLVEAQP